MDSLFWLKQEKESKAKIFWIDFYVILILANEFVAISTLKARHEKLIILRIDKCYRTITCKLLLLHVNPYKTLKNVLTKHSWLYKIYDKIVTPCF